MARLETAPSAHKDAPRLGVTQWHGSDAELVAMLQQSPATQAVAYLYDRFAEDVNRLVWRLLGADDQHDDLVQQVFCELVAGVKKLKQVAQLRAWVVTLTVNTVHTELRRRKVRRRHAVSDVDLSRLAATADDVEGRALLARAFAVLGLLKPEQRIAFALRYIEGMSLEDAAAACRCSLATFKRRLRRAQTRFGALAGQDPSLAERLARGRGGRS